MADVRHALPTALFAAVCIVLAGLTVRFLRADANTTAAGAPPAPEQLDSLSRYLQPVQPAALPTDFGMFIPADIPRPVEPGPTGYEPPRPTPAWRVSAIIIAGSRPIAIIDDRTVAPGSTLPDGSIVEAIESDHVIVRAPNGERHRLSLTTG